ncbi:hypothetical protein INR49_007592 [Caranx melampygus]|nr:hypothetical protein INR49_007592 [Caranx melampygus]
MSVKHESNRSITSPLVMFMVKMFFESLTRLTAHRVCDECAGGRRNVRKYLGTVERTCLVFFISSKMDCFYSIFSCLKLMVVNLLCSSPLHSENPAVLSIHLLSQQKLKEDIQIMARISCHGSSARLSPWVGLRKINVSYWGWEDASPFTNTSLRWLPGEPSDSGFCAYLERAQVAGLKANPCTATTDGLICEKPAGSPQSQSARPCKTPCALRTSCANCTSQAMECMWCGSAQRCVDSSAYVISFPYGQCLEWQTQDCTVSSHPSHINTSLGAGKCFHFHHCCCVWFCLNSGMFVYSKCERGIMSHGASF